MDLRLSLVHFYQLGNEKIEAWIYEAICPQPDRMQVIELVLNVQHYSVKGD